jgi:hypothetical protein
MNLSDDDRADATVQVRIPRINADDRMLLYCSWRAATPITL